jgi:hypothetical protein
MIARLRLKLKKGRTKIAIPKATVQMVQHKSRFLKRTEGVTIPHIFSDLRSTMRTEVCRRRSKKDL